MGFFKNLFKKVINAGTDFTPDFSKSEYDNWLEFLSAGGTSNEWNVLKRVNGWCFEEDVTTGYAKYQNEVTPVSNRYFALMEKIERDWSVLYNLKKYTGPLAVEIERDCLDDISYFKEMHEIDLKYGETSPQNIPAFRRLSMLYEKQERFEEAVAVCKDALSCGMDERSRMLRMIKKAGRSPSAAEESVLQCLPKQL